MWLKETHLANLFGAHARRGDVGHRARGKFESRICRINLVSQNGNADRVQINYFNLLAYQPLHNVEIMNHEIEHDIDIQRARRKLAHSMNLEIDEIVNVREQRDHRWIEAFQMADLQNSRSFRGRGNHPIRFL